MHPPAFAIVFIFPQREQDQTSVGLVDAQLFLGGERDRWPEIK
jgi:hypothetical protein